MHSANIPAHHPAPSASPTPAQPAQSFLQRSAARRLGLAVAVLAALWMVLMASLSAVD